MLGPITIACTAYHTQDITTLLITSQKAKKIRKEARAVMGKEMWFTTPTLADNDTKTPLKKYPSHTESHVCHQVIPFCLPVATIIQVFMLNESVTQKNTVVPWLLSPDCFDRSQVVVIQVSLGCGEIFLMIYLDESDELLPFRERYRVRLRFGQLGDRVVVDNFGHGRRI